MNDGLRINHILCDKQTVTRPETSAPSGVAFFEGVKNINESDFECNNWLDAVQGKGELLVKPEQAFVVTKILDAIYESARTGKAVYFND